MKRNTKKNAMKIKSPTLQRSYSPFYRKSPITLCSDLFWGFTPADTHGQAQAQLPIGCHFLVNLGNGSILAERALPPFDMTALHFNVAMLEDLLSRSCTDTHISVLPVFGTSNKVAIVPWHMNSTMKKMLPYHFPKSQALYIFTNNA